MAVSERAREADTWWCHKAEIAMVAESDGHLLSKTNPSSSPGGTGTVLRAVGPILLPNLRRMRLAPRNTRNVVPWHETSQAGGDRSGLGFPHH